LILLKQRIHPQWFAFEDQKVNLGKIVHLL